MDKICHILASFNYVSLLDTDICNGIIIKHRRYIRSKLREILLGSRLLNCNSDQNVPIHRVTTPQTFVKTEIYGNNSTKI
jgi:hypothetical protein